MLNKNGVVAGGFHFRLGWLLAIAATLGVAGCVDSQLQAHHYYKVLSASAIAYKQECAQGDKEQCLKFQRGQDRCREEIALGDSSANGLICRRMADEGIISLKQGRDLDSSVATVKP